MNPPESSINVLIQGVTGNVGSHIVKYALTNPRLKVNVVMRDPNKAPEVVQKVLAAGGKVMKGDLSDKDSLRDCTKGMHTVICTITHTEDKVSLEGQQAFIDDSIRNGVKLFVPSFFGMNYESLDRESLLGCPRTAFKIKINDYLRKTHLLSLKIYIGVMMEHMFEILKETKCYWGDPDLEHDLTSYENAARFTVEAVASRNCAGAVFYCGGSYTIKQIQDTYNKVRGTKIKIKYGGSLYDLQKLIQAKIKQGDEKTVGRLRLYLMIFSKRSKFPETNNMDFPHVKPTSLEEFLRENVNVRL